MHELSITRNIVAIVAEKAAGRAVRRVHLKIGRMSGIEVQAIQFCFGIVSEGTTVAGAELVIHEIDGLARCTGCGEEVPLEQPRGICPCERQARLEIVAGEELLIHALET